MKSRTLLRLPLMLSLIGITACSPDVARTEMTGTKTTTEKNEFPKAGETQPAVPMQKITPRNASALIAPMTGKQGVPPEEILSLEESALAPDFDSLDIAGNKVRLADFKDNVVVLDFWATWCGPCLASLPHTQDVASRYRDQGVVILAVCTSDTRAKFEAWVNVQQAKYPDVVFTCDPNERDSATFEDRASRRLYGVSGIPTQFVIGRDGKIAAVLVGALKEDVRLEAGLARAGIMVDAEVAARGEEQILTDN